MAEKATFNHAMQQLEPHRFSGLFPLIEGPAYHEFLADIRTNGVREPIVLFEEKILDGRNRYRAALESGIDCPTRTYDGDDPHDYVISLNLKRRHLNESQRAMIAAESQLCVGATIGEHIVLRKGVCKQTPFSVSVPNKLQT